VGPGELEGVGFGVAGALVFVGSADAAALVFVGLGEATTTVFVGSAGFSVGCEITPDRVARGVGCGGKLYPAHAFSS
jgi:hypothetical protein